MTKGSKNDSDKPPLWRDQRFQRISLVLVFFLVVTAVLSMDMPPKKILEVGKPSPETVRAPHFLSIIDSEKTEELRQRAADKLGKVYSHREAVDAEIQQEIKSLFGYLKDTKNNSTLSFNNQLKQLKERASKVSPEALEASLRLAPEEVALLETEALGVTAKLLEGDITSENIGDSKEKIKQLTSAFSQKDQNIVEEIVLAYIKPNYTYDAQKTGKIKRQAASRVKPIRLRKMEGETIVREGEIISAEQGKILQELGLLNQGVDTKRAFGLILLAIGIFGIAGAYLYRYQANVYNSPRLILLLGIILMAVILTAKFVSVFPSPYLTPVAAAAMLTTILFNPRLSITAVLVVSFLSATMVENKLAFLSMAVLGGLFAIYLTTSVSRRESLVRAGLWLSFALAYLIFTASLVTEVPFAEVLVSSGWGLIGGLSSTILTIGALPFLESSFNITTDLKLLELSNPNQPLLHQLMIKAPGTYTHSIYTSNIAEAAAKEVKANPLLTRVGAYYHDIGKIKRPLFFFENQAGAKNPHDKTQPHLSYLIIAAHVKEGVDLAKKHRLPPEIIQIIREHHGTSVVAYFFHRAKVWRKKEEVSELDFRYAGGRPQSKEAALIMLADSVEAMARSLNKPSPSRIEHSVRKAVQAKLADGQLNLSNLTLNDLEKIIKSFTQVLTSIYHSRVSYPDEVTAKWSKQTLSGKDYGKVVPLKRKRYGNSDK